MKSKIFSIRDNKVSVYHCPFFHENEIIAVRTLGMAVTDQKLHLAKFPEDYELFCLGEFDDISGKFTIYDNPKFIISAQTVQSNVLIRQSQNQEANNGKNN